VPVRLSGPRCDVGHVDPVAADSQGRLRDQAGARQPVVHDLDLPYLPGQYLLIVPADLDAYVGRGGDAALAGDRVVALRLVDVDDLGEPVVVGLRDTE